MLAAVKSVQPSIELFQAEVAQKAWQPPYFVRGAVNLREANESAEFWFHRRNGAVLAHADTYCIPAVSLQITGKKRWRLMPHPQVQFSRLAPDSHDGGIYRANWRPFWEITVHEGEALVFFPNLFHETHVPEENPECTVATTFQSAAGPSTIPQGVPAHVCNVTPLL